MASVLVIQLGTDQTFVFGARFTAGRSEFADVTVCGDKAVSGSHAEFYPRDGDWLVEDLGSTNGTALNGQRIREPRKVARGDQVKLGDTVLITVPAVAPHSLNVKTN